MRTTFALNALLLASTAVAAPFTEKRLERQRQRAALRKSNPPLAPNTEGVSNIISLENSTNVQYSSNWAGAVLISTGFTSVTGTVVVPHLSAGSSGTESAASAWVVIDGDTYGNAILQTGIDFYVDGSSISYDAWYEWLPDYAYTFTGFTLSAGDSIRMTVTASSKTAGTAKIENLTTGKSVSHSFSGQPSLGEVNAEWIVEDFESNGALVPFANFGTVTFTSASAVKNGATVGVTGATILDIKQNNQVLTDCSTSGSSTVTCTYE